MKNQAPKIGLYIRLSRDDLRLGESLSVENQRIFLTNYVKEQGWTDVTEYVDDGYTGVNFDRPSFKRMMNDVKEKKINLIICKDMSRFGRNYIQVGEFTDYILPSAGCALIALNDGVDTRQEVDNDMMPFRNLFNEFYCRDLSKKVKTGRNVRCQSGKYLGSYAPLGYILDPTDRYRYLVDEKGAQLVRRIFQMRCDGMSYLGISKRLNDEGVITPRDYWYQQREKPNPRRLTHKWTDITIKQILTNEAYIGNMVQQKTGHISYKNKKIVQKPEEEWIRAEGTHEAIIDPETWETVQRLAGSAKKYRSDKEKQPSLFSGLLQCADCGMSMKITKDMRPNRDGKSRDLHAYICRTYANGGLNACGAHRMREPVLIEIVKMNLQKHAERISFEEDTVRRDLLFRKDKEVDADAGVMKNELAVLEARLGELDRIIENLYEDKVSGKIPQNVFDRLLSKYEKERIECQNGTDSLRTEIASTEQTAFDIDRWIALVKNYMSVQTIDRTLLMSLIEKIIVSERKDDNGKKVQDIRIVYNFVGEV